MDTINQEIVTVVDPKERSMGVVLHLSALCGYFFPLANFIIPLVIWTMKKNESEFLDHQGREVLNFNISMLIYVFISMVLCLVLVGFLLLGILYIFGVVVTIMAAVKVNDGKPFRYPITIRFL